ncbi:MAG: Error-prone repair homolog of DNA polymerase III alpha subunit [uncultured Craurococcus sp.]|uniref:Error-prone DNA polymerase n=1 Tax=uncultured Craurococcus sp. TaxID=1135998 RepID=A0A6J4JVK8_9PROT|nr:MAG: Error-prone repair homolog of DNA polymerase III alpha subunit [uncultured Craurococcus sp.]
MAAPYAELQVTTNYSFLRGASHPEELFAAARALGLPALGIADRNTLAGIVRAHRAAEESGVRLVVGCRLDLADAPSCLVYPLDREGYGRLCRLLTTGKERAGAGGCHLAWADLAGAAEGLLAILVPEAADDALAAHLGPLREAFGSRAHLALTLQRRPGDAVRLRALEAMAAAARIPAVATGDVLYHQPERRILQDVVTCIRLGCTIEAAGFRRERLADRHLRAPEEMARLFRRHPAAVARSLEIMERCRFSLGELRYQYPDEIEDPALTPQQTLERLVWASAPLRYPAGVPEAVAAQLRHELRLVEQLDYAPYFLTVHAIVRYARSRGILCQGRGSAANSAICYVLAITSIDPVQSGLLFERFVSAERREPPDIDVDFEASRREEVIQWVYGRYGRDRAALCATVMRFRARGAVRDVGKVMGLPEDVTGALASQVWGWSEEGVQPEHAAELNLDPADRRLRLTLELARELIGFPRQLGTHPGGFVLTRDRLDSLVPIAPAAMANRQVVEWDKDDIEALGFMKVDVLGLGMLGCLRRAFELLAEQGAPALSIAAIPKEDEATYAMIRKADTLGTFQIESRAQMAMLPRLKPRTLYDLVIQVAIVRPGPIQGDMVHPYLRRREGKEDVTYPKPELKRVLGKTLGVPLFQEQAMQVAIHCAGFSPGEADQLRRSMATFKFQGGVSHFREKLVTGMVERGYEQDFAERTFRQIEGFGSYGFPESHAASFALIAYASAWVKCHHPAVFCCALLNSQPMGFYAPAQVVRDAREHGVEIRPVCVNASRWDCMLERAADGRLALRLGLRMVLGLGNADAARLVAHRTDQPYASVEEAWRRAGLPPAALERLAEADGFHALGLDRRAALWAVRGLAEAPLPLFAAAEQAAEPEVALQPMTAGHEVVEDYRSTGLSLRAHPVAFLRPELAARRMLSCAALADGRDGTWVLAAGMVLVRQKPGSAKGVMFITIEDETGVANLILWPKVFEAQRRLVLSAGMLACRGRLQREGEVLHVIVHRLEDLSAMLAGVEGREGGFPLRHGRGDEATHAGAGDLRERAGGRPVRDITIPDLRLGSGIKVPTRDFR